MFYQGFTKRCFLWILYFPHDTCIGVFNFNFSFNLKLNYPKKILNSYYVPIGIIQKNRNAGMLVIINY